MDSKLGRVGGAYNMSVTMLCTGCMVDEGRIQVGTL